MSSMGGNNTANVDGVGALNYQRAIDIARNTEGDLDPSVSEYLDNAIQEIWNSIIAYPDTYVLTKDEFAVFNYYRGRFEGDLAERAVDRYWRSTHSSEQAQARD